MGELIPFSSSLSASVKACGGVVFVFVLVLGVIVSVSVVVVVVSIVEGGVGVEVQVGGGFGFGGGVPLGDRRDVWVCGGLAGPEDSSGE